MWNWTENQINLVLIRHGATAANQTKCYLGRSDEALSADGMAQLEKQKEHYPTIDGLIISPMKRCLQTAQILYPNQKPINIPEFCEIDFGEFEGKNYHTLKGDDRYQAWINSGGTLAFPGGESRTEFIARCKNGMEKVIAMIEEGTFGEPQTFTLGAVVHGGTIMALCSTYGDGGYFDYQVPNGAGYCCKLNWNENKICLTDICEIEREKEE